MADNNNDHSYISLPKRTIATSIELPIFLIMAAISITGSALSNIILYRTCVYALDHTVEECTLFLSPVKTNTTTDLEIEVQKYSTYVTTVKTVLENVCPAILSLFVGVWSDTYGRKRLLVWPLFGMSITGIFIVIFGMVDNLNPWWLLFTSIPFSIAGGYLVLFMGAYCYINDTSSPSNKTIRMLILDASTSLGSFMGSMFSSYLIATIGYVHVLLLCATINVIAYAFASIWIVESLTRAIQGGSRMLFNFSHVKEMLRECFKQRPNYGRYQIIALAIIRLFLIIIFIGSSTLEYLYSRDKLHWSLRDYTTFSAIDTATTFIGAYLSVIVFQRVLQIGDITFMIIAISVAGGNYIIKLFAVQSWQMYLSICFSPFKGLPIALINSYVTKLMPEEDTAKVFALLCAAESLAPIIGPVVYNSLYSSTLSVFPGAIYVISIVMNTACVVMLLQLLYYTNRSSTN